MRDDPTYRRVRRGYGLIAGAVLVALLILNVDVIADLFGDHVDIVALVTETSGVRPGSPVVVAGVEVGRVVDVGVAPGPEAAVGLTLRVDRDATSIVRRGSRARTTNRRFIGEPVVVLTAGAVDAPALGARDTLGPAESVSVQRLIERGRDFPASLDSLREALAGVQDLTAAGRFDRLARGIEDVAEEAAELQAHLDDGRMMDFGPALTGRLQDLSKRVAELADAAHGVERFAGSDVLRRNSARLAARAQQIAARLKRLEGRFNDGTLSRFQRDSALVKAVAGVTAQIDSLTSEGLGFALRMLLP